MSATVATQLHSVMSEAWASHGDGLKGLSEMLAKTFDEVLGDFSARVREFEGSERHVTGLREHWLELVTNGPGDDYLERAKQIGALQLELGIDPKAQLAHYTRLIAQATTALQKRRRDDESLVLFNLLSIDLMVTMLAFEQLSTERSEQRRVTEVLDGTRKLATTVTLFNQASKSIATLARNAQRTAEGSQLISAAAEEMATTIRAISGNAHEVTTAADQSREAISEAQDLAKSTEDLMSGASRSAEAMSGSVRALADTSREINSILALISKVAAQTRILALNAAIEAARAGAAGKGFGVVAAEVKALARTVAEAAGDISTRIEKLREVVDELGARSKASEQETHAGAETVARMRARLSEVVERVGNVASNIHGITDILAQQEIASADVAKNITRIATLERESASLVSHIADETRSANDTLTKTAPSMAHERSPRVLLEVAKIDHVLFKKRIVDAMLGGVTWHAKDVPDHHHCRFGKWFDGAHELAGVEGFKALEGPHRRVHEAATECLRRLEERDPDAALVSLDEMEQASKVMLAALDAVGAVLEVKKAG